MAFCVFDPLPGRCLVLFPEILARPGPFKDRKKDWLAKESASLVLPYQSRPSRANCGRPPAPGKFPDHHPPSARVPMARRVPAPDSMPSWRGHALGLPRRGFWRQG